ncbi:MAG: bifunctional glycosyltransferase family 2/GtrA family protein [Desulfobacula sp.]|nr:bifunctional glycosyltransferase family 2/GtrA family protein [Desulfobacula sp.]
MKPVIVIPAYNPEKEILIALVKQILTFDIEKLIVINDGSNPECSDVFNSLEKIEKITVLYHKENLGKGAALRTGFEHILKFKMPCKSIITVDADGQHLPGDVKKIIDRAGQMPDAFILGVRQFKGHIPLRSLLGNKMTYLMFRGLVGKKISDTQTGLRAIPKCHLDKIVTLSSDRYAYELEMLLTLVQDGLPIIEVPVATVYQNNNEVSSFRPIADSVMVYQTLFMWWFSFRFKQLLKYSLSGVFSTIADFGAYIILINLSCGFVTASILARMLSILIHFSSNKYFTFSYKNAPDLSEIAKYLLVVVFNLVSSIFLIFIFVRYLSMGEVVAKVVAQMLLFFATYTLLNGFVFLRSKRKESKQIRSTTN